MLDSWNPGRKNSRAELFQTLSKHDVSLLKAFLPSGQRSAWHPYRFRDLFISSLEGSDFFLPTDFSGPMEFPAVQLCRFGFVPSDTTDLPGNIDPPLPPRFSFLASGLASATITVIEKLLTSSYIPAVPDEKVRDRQQTLSTAQTFLDRLLRTQFDIDRRLDFVQSDGFRFQFLLTHTESFFILTFLLFFQLPRKNRRFGHRRVVHYGKFPRDPHSSAPT